MRIGFALSAVIIALLILFVLFAPVIYFGNQRIIHNDEDYSESENRKLRSETDLVQELVAPVSAK
ncbi:MAG TPA: hypothetical protein VFF30_06030 [Nitrososphaerales archaeon]|nr:hypothetical protein [Nitrososphaerales archaeon]